MGEEHQADQKWDHRPRRLAPWGQTDCGKTRRGGSRVGKKKKGKSCGLKRLGTATNPKHPFTWKETGIVVKRQAIEKKKEKGRQGTKSKKQGLCEKEVMDGQGQENSRKEKKGELRGLVGNGRRVGFRFGKNPDAWGTTPTVRERGGAEKGQLKGLNITEKKTGPCRNDKRPTLQEGRKKESSNA